MSIEPHNRPSGTAHVVVFGNEKGGTGKSTIAMHVIVALMQAGQRVATIDLDSRQRTLTHYIENRRSMATRKRIKLDLPTHHCVACTGGASAESNEAAEYDDLAQTIVTVEADHDFLVIDTPGTDNYLMRLGHSMADTLVTPLHDSLVDVDVLGTADPATFAVTEQGRYAATVAETRRQRRQLDGGSFEWVVVRNRLSMVGMHGKRLIAHRLADLAPRLGFRLVDGLGERAVYRELYSRGLTVFDDLDEAMLGARPTMSHVAAREEAMQLFAELRLPLTERISWVTMAGMERWRESAGKPLEMHDDLVDG
jgi:chromosome partitioning protein